MNRLILPAFSAYGVELEYMIVDRHTLDIRPLARNLLCHAAGGPCCEVQRGLLAWSNELVSHVIEIKNPHPGELARLAQSFQNEVGVIDSLLTEYDAQLMPTAMHPWMNPQKETQLWPGNPIYETYHRIFNCRQHGWANLQSMHINLPFADDAEFVRLHAAIRLVLPILPVLAASSPIANGKRTGFADYRMECYRICGTAIPSVAGALIPEVFHSRSEYSAMLKTMYDDIAVYDTDGILQAEWLNSRGAIARFDRNAIEIRVADMQECPSMDLAIAGVVIDVVKLLYEGRLASFEDQQHINTLALAGILRTCMVSAEQAELSDREYLQLFKFPHATCRATELWRHLTALLQAEIPTAPPAWSPQVNAILEEGSLAGRIIQAVGENPSASELRQVYGRLSECLESGEMFHA